MPVIYIIESRRAIQYTGSNSAEIDAEIVDLTIDSEFGGVLTVTSNSVQRTVNTNDWIIFWQGYIQNVFSDEAFNFFYIANVVVEP